MIRHCIAFFVVAACLIGPRSGQAAELIMFEQQGCPYCERFDHEIAPIWPLTKLGRRAPLRRVDIYKSIPPDLGAISVERLTPVFVVVDQGREIGRIRGYSNPDNFWGLVANLIDDLPAETVTSPTQISFPGPPAVTLP